MSEWRIIKLSECCSSIADGDHQPPPKAESGIPFITISNFTSTNALDFSDTMFVPKAYYDALDEKRKPNSGDIIYSIVGATLGIPIYIRDDKPFVFQRHIGILRCDKSIVDPRFLYYVMLSRGFYLMADSVAVGAAQRTIGLASLRNLEIRIPSLKMQSRIAAILSAYDDLIENNQHQIKLLEEAAQRLYKEWFVDLRYPGHENVPVVDSLPEGWSKGILGDIALFRRGQMITKAHVHDGNVPVVAGGLEPSCYHDEANTVAPVITVSGSGANAGFTRLYSVNVFASDCSFVDRNTSPYLYFAYCYLKANKSRLGSLQKGSAQPHVYAKDLNALTLVVPSNHVLEAFCRYITPFFEKIGVLERAITQSSQARDRLLPKLISGEIAV